MAQKIREIMSSPPVVLSADDTAAAAARAMRDQAIGDVLVADGDRFAGLVTDRDLVVRVLAEDRDPSRTTLREICSGDLVTVSPDDDVSRAVDLIRERAIRRLPVVEGTRPVGVVSIGDLAIERDQTSALADISAAKPNS